MNEFFDLNAMMFPSADPFAYPNNPMTIFEDQQQKRGVLDTSMGGNPMVMSDAVSNNIPYDNLEVQLYDPLPPYLAQPGQATAPRLVVPVGSSTSAAPSSGGGVPGGYVQQVDTTMAGLQPGFSLDQIFGNNEWGSSNFLAGRRNQHEYPG